ncbi:MAG: hypothetical protein JWN93_2842 [Hyphomicrobiales bacterium]|nr:hypothetical protein [Hyphomicrobiales bacterium]
MYKTVILQRCGDNLSARRRRAVAAACAGVTQFMRIKSKTALASARKQFDEGAPLGAIARSLGLNASQFLALRRAQGWPERPRKAKGAKPTAAPDEPADPSAPPPEARPAEPPAAPTDLAELRRRLEQAVERELSAVAGRLSGSSVAAGERNARLLASLVKTFAELRRMEALDAGQRGKSGAGGHGADDEPAPRDLDALRHELARTVERIARDRPAG